MGAGSRRMPGRTRPARRGGTAPLAALGGLQLPAGDYRLPLPPAPAPARGDRLPWRPRSLEHRLPARDTGSVHRLGHRPARRPAGRARRGAWAVVPLAPPGQLAEAGFDPLRDLPARLRLFLDAYGLTDRTAILPALQRRKLDEPEQLRWFQETRRASPAHYDPRHAGVRTNAALICAGTGTGHLPPPAVSTAVTVHAARRPGPAAWLRSRARCCWQMVAQRSAVAAPAPMSRRAWRAGSQLPAGHGQCCAPREG